MRYLLVSAAAAMALAGAATLGNAQAPDSDKGKGPAAEGQAPGSGGAQREPGKSERSQQPMPNRAEPKSEPRRGAEREAGRDQPRATQQPRDKQPRSTQGPETGKDRSKSATPPDRDMDRRKATEQREPSKDQRRSTEQQQPGKDKKAAEQREPGKDQPRSSEQRRPGKDQKATEQRQPSGDPQKSTQGADQKQGGRIQVGEQERSGVRDRIMKDRRVERAKVNVSINIGTRLPRSVRLHTLPIAIVSFAPAYRGYSYVMLEDETICIVDPRTYTIVDVIPVGTQRADRTGRTYLSLSTEDLRFIYRTVPKNRTVNVRVRMALGAEVPRDIDLIEFPAEVVERVPDVRRYRYIVTDNDVVIVDPNDYAVALVIND